MDYLTELANISTKHALEMFAVLKETCTGLANTKPYNSTVANHGYRQGICDVIRIINKAIALYEKE